MKLRTNTQVTPLLRGKKWINISETNNNGVEAGTDTAAYFNIQDLFLKVKLRCVFGTQRSLAGFVFAELFPGLTCQSNGAASAASLGLLETVGASGTKLSGSNDNYDSSFTEMRGKKRKKLLPL